MVMSIRPGNIQMVFFDAGGTLFDVRGSVGEIYSAAARRHGVAIAPEILQHAFVRYFRHHPPLAFPRDTPARELTRLERAWWFRLVSQVFAEFGEFPHIDAFFADVYELFRTPEGWQLYSETIPALDALRAQGLRLAVISNFDSRLDDLLKALKIDRYFEAVHLSSRIGAAKPNPEIFQTALASHGLAAQQAVHVGDSLDEDAAGAAAAGLQAVWLDRRSDDHADRNAARISRLTDLIELL